MLKNIRPVKGAECNAGDPCQVRRGKCEVGDIGEDEIDFDFFRCEARAATFVSQC